MWRYRCALLSTARAGAGDGPGAAFQALEPTYAGASTDTRAGSADCKGNEGLLQTAGLGVPVLARGSP